MLDDIPPDAAKTGALGSAAVIEGIARRAEGFSFPLIVDPVMISKHGAALIDSDAMETLISKLLPRTYLVTPNLREAAALAEMEVVRPRLGRGYGHGRSGECDRMDRGRGPRPPVVRG